MKNNGMEAVRNHFEDIYVLPVGPDFLLYSPLRGISALVNRSALSKIVLLLKDNIKEETISDTISELAIALLSEPPRTPEKRTGQIMPPFLGIIPTRACNMACRYCDFDSKNASKKQMDLSLAKSAVDWMAKNVRHLGGGKLEIHFFGGEPIVAGEVVDFVVHRARTVAGEMGLMPHFEISTNGFFDEKRAMFLGDYFDAVILSFDGFKEHQDRHRPVNSYSGSFETVKKTASLLSHSPTDLCFRCCVSQYNVTSMEDISHWFCNKFSPSAINFETVCENPESQSENLKAPEPYLFSKHYINACRIIKNYGIKAVYAAAEMESPRNTFCPVGKDTLIVSPNGRISGCYLQDQAWKEKGLDLDLGWISDDGRMDINIESVERLRDLVIQKKRCKRCFCRFSCAGGCHVSHSYPGCSVEYDNFCIQTRIITACVLLDQLGLKDRADFLLDQKEQMKALARQVSDKLDDVCLSPCDRSHSIG